MGLAVPCELTDHGPQETGAPRTPFRKVSVSMSYSNKKPIGVGRCCSCRGSWCRCSTRCAEVVHGVKFSGDCSSQVCHKASTAVTTPSSREKSMAHR